MIIVKLFILSFHHHGFKNINANHSIQKVQLIWEMKEDKYFIFFNNIYKSAAKNQVCVIFHIWEIFRKMFYPNL